MSLIQYLVEKLARPGLLGLRGKKLEKTFRRDLEAYFRRLGRDVKKLKLELVVEHQTKDAAVSAVTVMLQNALRLHRPTLKAVLTVNLRDGLEAGFKVHPFTEAEPGETEIPPPEFPGIGDLTPEDIDFLGQSGQDAAAWAEQYAAQLVVGIDATTVKIIAKVIAQGIEERLGVPQTARLLASAIDGMTSERAYTIALTEMNAAMSEAALQKLERLNIGYKRWILGPDPCEICEANADEDAIPVGDTFDSGDLRPPAHPNCRCALVGARAPEAA